MPAEDDEHDPLDDDHFRGGLYNLIFGGDLDGAFVYKFYRTLNDDDDRREFDNYLSANYLRVADHDYYLRRPFDYDLYVPDCHDDCAGYYDGGTCDYDHDYRTTDYDR